MALEPRLFVDGGSLGASPLCWIWAQVLLRRALNWDIGNAFSWCFAYFQLQIA